MRLIRPIWSIFAVLFLVLAFGLGAAWADGDADLNDASGAYRPPVVEGQMQPGQASQGRSIYGADVNAQDFTASQRARQAQYEQMRQSGQTGGVYYRRSQGYYGTTQAQNRYVSGGGGGGGGSIVNYNNDRDVEPRHTAELIHRDLDAMGSSMGGPLRADINVTYQAQMHSSFYEMSVMAPNGQRASDQGHISMYNQDAQIRTRLSALVQRLASGLRNQASRGYGNPNRGLISGAGEATSSGCRGDDDCDGVPNFRDQCPDTPKGVKVNKLGCPGSVVYGPCVSLTPCAQAQGGPCAGQAINPCAQPAGSPCAANPPPCGSGTISPCASAGPCANLRGAPSCPNDDDCDGVENCRDFCPCTPPGCPVDKCGCTVKAEDKWVVEFDVDKYFIRQNEKEKLNRLATLVASKPYANLILSGHTDSDASDAHNMTLSHNRAKSVMNYLAGRGVPTSRMRIQWFGERDPIATNSTATGKQRNRRTMILLVSR